jgi:hypothetical protein
MKNSTGFKENPKEVNGKNSISFYSMKKIMADINMQRKSDWKSFKQLLKESWVYLRKINTGTSTT